jgi:hypothetical protein
MFTGAWLESAGGPGFLGVVMTGGDRGAMKPRRP